MEKSKAPVFTMGIVAIIVGSALYKQINFNKMTVEKPALSVLYVVTFLFAVAVLVRHYTRRAEINLMIKSNLWLQEDQVTILYRIF